MMRRGTVRRVVGGGWDLRECVLYEYDELRRLRRGLHYNAVQVVNRNLYAYDGGGRLIQERFERNYRYDADGHQVVTTTRFDVGHDVAIIYDDRGQVQQRPSRICGDGNKGIRSFATMSMAVRSKNAVMMLPTAHGPQRHTGMNMIPVGNWITETFQWWNCTDGDSGSNNHMSASVGSPTTNIRRDNTHAVHVPS